MDAGHTADGQYHAEWPRKPTHHEVNVVAGRTLRGPPALAATQSCPGSCRHPTRRLSRWGRLAEVHAGQHPTSGVADEHVCDPELAVGGTAPVARLLCLPADGDSGVAEVTHVDLVPDQRSGDQAAVGVAVEPLGFVEHEPERSDQPEIRRRDFVQDGSVTVLLRLRPPRSQREDLVAGVSVHRWLLPVPARPWADPAGTSAVACCQRTGRRRSESPRRSRTTTAANTATAPRLPPRSWNRSGASGWIVRRAVAPATRRPSGGGSGSARAQRR